MSKLIVSDNGRLYTKDDFLFADKVMEARVKKGPWDVIDILVEHWKQRFPQEVEDINKNLAQYKETLTDKEFGTTKDGKDFERRFTTSFPRNLMLLIRTQYKADELPFDRKFIHKFLTKYPKFKVTEKL